MTKTNEIIDLEIIEEESNLPVVSSAKLQEMTRKIEDDEESVRKLIKLNITLLSILLFLSIAYIAKEIFLFLSAINWAYVSSVVLKVGAGVGIIALVVFGFIARLGSFQNGKNRCSCSENVNVNVNVEVKVERQRALS